MPSLKRAICAALAAGSMLCLNVAAQAANTDCTGTMTGGTITGTLTVPSGETCTLDGTTVNGNVFVDPGACLVANGVTITGNVSATKAECLGIYADSTVEGNLTALGTTGAAPANPVAGYDYICHTTIGGNLTIDNSGKSANWCIGCTADCGAPNTITHSFTFDSNLGGGAIEDNTITGNLICESNNPAPTGSGNTAANYKKPTLGQCSALVSGTP